MLERWLAPDEFHLLEPTLESNGWASLNQNMTQVRAAFDGDKLIAFLVLQQYPVLGPLWVAPEYRGNGLPGRLALEMKNFINEIKIRGFIVISESVFTEAMCEHFGMKRVESPVYML